MPISDAPAVNAGVLLDEARDVTDRRLAEVARRLDAPAFTYALQSPGKRWRPALVIAAFRAAGGEHPGSGRRELRDGGRHRSRLPGAA